MCLVVAAAARIQAEVKPEAGGEPAASPFASFTRDWRDDPLWYDGKAEYAIYDATRVLYGEERSYRARVMVNKELADPVTKTKSAGPTGREVFKLHVREDVPTERYDYHFSTMCYVGSQDLKSLKLEQATLEDCGASFREFVNHQGVLRWTSFVYFPGTGRKEGSRSPSASFAFLNALPVVLRGYPFAEPREIAIGELMADQAGSRETRLEPVAGARVTSLGREALELPVGSLEAYHLRLHVPGPQGEERYDYWFHAEAGPPWLHVLVAYRAPGGVSLRLREHKRWAYWER